MCRGLISNQLKMLLGTCHLSLDVPNYKLDKLSH